MGSLYSFVKGGIGLPHSPAGAGLARITACRFVREVVECGSPMPLLRKLPKLPSASSRTPPCADGEHTPSIFLPSRGFWAYIALRNRVNDAIGERIQS